MSKTQTVAQHYNNKMDKIFENAKRLKQERYKEACKISDHLLKTNQGFCYTEDGRMFDRELCHKIIDDYNTL